MTQPGGDYADEYLDTLEGSSSSEGAHDEMLPLPTTDGGGGAGVQLPDVTEQVSESTDKLVKGSYKGAGEAAATRDFQQAHGAGWEYDSEAMKKQIEKLEDLRDGKLREMSLAKDAVTDITPPAEDKVSQEFIQYAEASGRSHNEQFEEYIRYVQGYIETLRKINKIYQDEDEQAAQELLSEEL